MNKCLLAILAVVLVFRATGVQAADNAWTLEITPYAWLAGIDADVTVGPRTGNIDVGFGDLVDYVDLAGGLLVTVEKNRWIGWAQGDFMSLTSDNKATKFDILGTLETKMSIVEAAVGYQFDNPLVRNAVVDVLVGGRYTYLKNKFAATTGQTVEKDRTLFDPMLVLRPWFPITDKLAFNPTLAIGGGADADLIYELQPQFRYNFTPRFSVSVGYRRLYYKVTGDKLEFDGAVHGALVGFGMEF